MSDLSPEAADVAPGADGEEPTGTRPTTGSAPALRTTVVVALADAALRVATLAALDTASDIESIGTASTPSDALTKVRDGVPDVLLLGTDVAGEDLRSLCTTIDAEMPAVRIVIVADEHDDSYPAVTAGAVGCVRPEDLMDTVVDIVRRVSWGEGLVTPEWARAVLADLGDRASDDQVGGPLGRPGLSTTELEVLRRTVNGATPAAIAELHGVTERDVNRNAAYALVKAHRFHHDKAIADQQ